MSNGDEKHVQQSTGGRSDRGMESEWIECTLADVCSSIDYGFTASATIHNTGLKFLRITDIVTGHIDWSNVPYVDADSKATAKYRLNNGDIVIARTGASTGSSTYVMDPPTALFASYLVRLKIRSEFDPRYVAYYLRSDQFWTFIQGVLGDKSAQPNASASTMTSAPFRAPRTIDEQRAIAHILGTLDDKIELNRRMNETLEAMARAIFKSWFVDFDPVRAKAEGRPTGLPDEIAALFPDSFEESELGEIPRGWGVGTIGDIGSQSRIGVKPEEIEPTEHYIALEHMPKRSISFWNWENSNNITSGKFRFKKNDILFGKLRPYFHKVGVAAIDGICSTDIVVVIPRKEQCYGILLGHLSSDAFVAYTNASSTGTKMPRTSWKDMSRYPITIPDHLISLYFNEIITNIVQKLHSNIYESKSLTALRDTLLPKLISGELPIPDAEKFIEEAGDE